MNIGLPTVENVGHGCGCEVCSRSFTLWKRLVEMTIGLPTVETVGYDCEHQGGALFIKQRLRDNMARRLNQRT
jgi:hypothetical protein